MRVRRACHGPFQKWIAMFQPKTKNSMFIPLDLVLRVFVC